jgi:hypothetical protein
MLTLSKPSACYAICLTRKHTDLVSEVLKLSMVLLLFGEMPTGLTVQKLDVSSGNVVQFHGATVHWRLCKQSSVAKRTMIAEYFAASNDAVKCTFFDNLLCEL